MDARDWNTLVECFGDDGNGVYYRGGGACPARVVVVVVIIGEIERTNFLLDFVGDIE
jgi:hypothetical protein